MPTTNSPPPTFAGQLPPVSQLMRPCGRRARASGGLTSSEDEGGHGIGSTVLSGGWLRRGITDLTIHVRLGRSRRRAGGVCGLRAGRRAIPLHDSRVFGRNTTTSRSRD